ncbi:MAG: CatA-like O-acetyltransferase [Cyclobacteriaceae bacterium]|nr:CatA-like O-acetyltransferase [Cyclobacteriaceae bacterium]
MKKLDLSTWNRNAHFDFFKSYDQPFFGITAEVDITKAYIFTKERGVSFFLYYLHKSLVAIHEIEPFNLSST